MLAPLWKAQNFLLSVIKHSPQASTVFLSKQRTIHVIQSSVFLRKREASLHEVVPKTGDLDSRVMG